MKPGIVVKSINYNTIRGTTQPRTMVTFIYLHVASGKTKSETVGARKLLRQIREKKFSDKMKNIAPPCAPCEGNKK